MFHTILSEIGIIGGSDGPTAVYVTGSYNPAVTIITVSAVIVAIAFAAIVLRRRKK